jgi:hypothetical protein
MTIARRAPHDDFAMSVSDIGEHLGVSREVATQELRKALRSARRVARDRGLEGPWVEALRHLDHAGPVSDPPTTSISR